MKMLCLQLARFGDIYQTWPALHALRRKWPEAEIHFLVREKFKSATDGLSAINKVISLSTAEVLRPIIMNQGGVEGALACVDRFVADMQSEKYDAIYNLTYSPSSSFLTELVAGPQAGKAGYTRHSDGFLAIPDDVSSYIYAQVGVDRENRIHLSDLFALTCNVGLEEEDFRGPQLTHDLPNSLNVEGSYVLVHVGASVAHKSCSKETWQQIVSRLNELYSGKIIFVGADSERHLVPRDILSPSILDFVGQTSLLDLFTLLKSAEALLACDSMLIHMGSLEQTPILNISFGSVRFWETGPRSRRSRVVWYPNNQKLDVQHVCAEMLRLLKCEPPGEYAIERTAEAGVLYKLYGYGEESFGWDLIQALYMGKEFPIVKDNTVRLSFQRMLELSELGLEKIPQVQDEKMRETAVSTLDQIDLLIAKVAEVQPKVSPLVRWFQAEKLRIAPGSLQQIMQETQVVFQKLHDVCQMYVINCEFNDSMPRQEMTWKS